MHNRCVISFCGRIVYLFYIFVTKEKNCVIKNLLPNFNDLSFACTGSYKMVSGVHESCRLPIPI